MDQSETDSFLFPKRSYLTLSLADFAHLTSGELESEESSEPRPTFLRTTSERMRMSAGEKAKRNAHTQLYKINLSELRRF